MVEPLASARLEVDMIENVARAIYAAANGYELEHIVFVDPTGIWTKQARAAIAAYQASGCERLKQQPGRNTMITFMACVFSAWVGYGVCACLTMSNRR